MSGYKVHIAFGLILSFFVYLLLSKFGFASIDVKDIIIVTLISVIYSILPDIDIRTSKAYKLFMIISILAIIYLLLLNKVIYIIALLTVILMTLFLRHRGLTHRWWFGILISLPLLLVSKIYFLIGVVSYFSHLILDHEL